MSLFVCWHYGGVYTGIMPHSERLTIYHKRGDCSRDRDGKARQDDVWGFKSHFFSRGPFFFFRAMGSTLFYYMVPALNLITANSHNTKIQHMLSFERGREGFMKNLFVMLSGLVLLGCQSYTPKVVFPENDVLDIQWSVEDKRKPMAVKPIYKSDSTSAAIIRISENEKPHYHDRHDLRATIVRGRMAINFENRRVELAPGDTIFIPKGAYHWVELIGEEAVEAFAVFSPAFDGKDRRFVEE